MEQCWPFSLLPAHPKSDIKCLAEGWQVPSWLGSSKDCSPASSFSKKQVKGADQRADISSVPKATESAHSGGAFEGKLKHCLFDQVIIHTFKEHEYSQIPSLLITGADHHYESLPSLVNPPQSVNTHPEPAKDNLFRINKKFHSLPVLDCPDFNGESEI